MRLGLNIMIMLLTSRDSYKSINLDKSYQSLIELLWYSQLPCFDVVNVTTKVNEEFGNSLSWWLIKVISKRTLCSRHDQEVLLEGHEAKLFKCLHHAPF